MVRYFLNDTEVSRDEAFYAWRFSQTYRQARHNHVIWDNAHHGQTGALNHLREAGIRIDPDSPQEASDATTEVAVKNDAGFTAKQEASDA